MNQTPDISICTAVSDGDHNVVLLLDSVKKTADPVNVECVVVISGAVSDFGQALDRVYPEVKILENRAVLSFGQARNQAHSLASGRYLAFFDRDVILQPHCLLRLCSTLDEHPEVGIAVPRVMDSGGSNLPSLRPFPSLLSVLLKHSGLASLFRENRRLARHLCEEVRDGVMQEIDWSVGSAAVFRRELVNEIGLPDEHYLHSYGDADYYRRAKKAGWHNILLANALVVHDAPERYNPFHVLDPDPLAPSGRQRTDPTQLLDAVRYLLTAFTR